MTAFTNKECASHRCLSTSLLIMTKCMRLIRSEHVGYADMDAIAADVMGRSGLG
jgi:hypothetical protein